VGDGVGVKQVLRCAETAGAVDEPNAPVAVDEGVAEVAVAVCDEVVGLSVVD
jgi:hypothetical protein